MCITCHKLGNILGMCQFFVIGLEPAQVLNYETLITESSREICFLFFFFYRFLEKYVSNFAAREKSQINYEFVIVQTFYLSSITHVIFTLIWTSLINNSCDFYINMFSTIFKFLYSTKIYQDNAWTNLVWFD